MEIEFIVGKRKVMHFGRKNQNEERLPMSGVQKNQGVLVYATPKIFYTGATNN